MSRTLNRLSDLLFQSLLDDPPWLAFLEGLEREMPCHHATLVLRKPRDGDPGVVVCSPRDAAAVAALQQDSYRDSPFLDLPEGEICFLHEMMDQTELQIRHPRYVEYVRRFSGAHDLAGINLLEPSTGMVYRFRMARLRDEPPFGTGERRLLFSLLPRLLTAVALHARLALEQYKHSVLDESTARLALGSLVLDATGRVLVTNVVADRILRERDGFMLREGILRCIDDDDQRTLRAHLSKLDANPETPPRDITLRVTRSHRGETWSVLIRPDIARPGLDEQASRTVLVLLRDAAQKPDTSPATLAALFGFTRAESALASHLASGTSLIDAAAALGVSRHTARAQLASMFSRTGTHRQAELVSLILGTVNRIWA